MPLLVKANLDSYLLVLLQSFKQDDLYHMFLNIRDCKKIPESVDKQHFLNMGQLSVKHEAAGKIRVFALVDVWTQSCLKPLHEMIFAFLRSLPNDGTFNQEAAVKRAGLLAKKYNCSFGYDLSAATDRLPISLQVAVLSPIIGEEAAIAWRNLLVERLYRLEILDENGVDVHIARYSVGQPMGALSS